MRASVVGLALALAAGEGGPRFGVAAISGTAACLASPGTRLAEGTAVTLVLPEKPQRIHRATVRAPTGACTILERAGIGGPYYELAASPTPADAPMAVAILGAAKAAVRNGVAEVTFGAAGEPVTVRSCSSREGIHLTAWRGKPLEGTRVWHAYWYLGYDVEPSCTEKDAAQ